MTRAKFYSSLCINPSTFSSNRNGTIDFPSEEWSSISPVALNLVKRMLEKDPTKRITLREVLENEWVVAPPRRGLQLPQRSMQSMQALQMSLPSTLPGSHFCGRG